MKKLAITLALAGMTALAPQAATAQEVGDWVLSPWRDGDYFFPGVIVASSGNAVTVRFDDGTSENRLVSDVRPFNWRVGSKIECQWSDGNWYDATIRWLAEDGYTMQIRYDDGTVERTNTGKCRSA